MENCIFCKIISSDIPSHKVFETDDFLASLDIHLQSSGHVQVIPKKHYRWVWDLPAAPSAAQAGVPGNNGEYFSIVHKIALAQRKAFSTDWILSKIVGDEVEHAHIWVYPDRNVKGDMNDFEGNAEKIRQNLQ